MRRVLELESPIGRAALGGVIGGDSGSGRIKENVDFWSGKYSGDIFTEREDGGET